MHTANPLKILSFLPPSDNKKATEAFDVIWGAEENLQEMTIYMVAMEFIITVMVYMAMTDQKKTEKEIPEVVVEE